MTTQKSSERLEVELYPHVKRWLHSAKHCFKAEITPGLRNVRIDVVGVADVGGTLSGEVETIAVEVKRGRTPFANAYGQTLGYKPYASRMYLADERNSAFSVDELAIATHLGIGLLQIKGRKVVEILASPLSKPLTRFNDRLLERLHLCRCQICGSVVEVGDINKKDLRYVANGLMKSVRSKDKGAWFWNEEVFNRKLKYRLLDNEQSNFERRLICKECVDQLLTPLIKPAQ